MRRPIATPDLRISPWYARWTVCLTALLFLIALLASSYRELLGRAFAADDYQWLLSVRHLSLLGVFQHAFDPMSQRHFYRPLIWLLFWSELRLFGLDPRGFHLVSFGLHLVNALLAAFLFLRLVNHQGNSASLPRWLSVLVFGMVALHPAPFEAVVWVSAQSELLGAALLLIALNLWLMSSEPQNHGTKEPRLVGNGRWIRRQVPAAIGSAAGGRWSVAAATLALALAMLAKESAVLGLPLMLLLSAGRSGARSWRSYLLPGILTLGFVILQFSVGRENVVLREGLYGFGPQLVTNPLRSLALVAAPLHDTEHADAGWLVPVGAITLCVLAMAGTIANRALGGRWSMVSLFLSLLLVLTPTAPFLSPPDSRYLYLPVVFFALFVGILTNGLTTRRSAMSGSQSPVVSRRWSVALTLGVLTLCLLGAWWASQELSYREWRFAASSGPGGSLWHLTDAICSSVKPNRVILVDAPILEPHAQSIVALSCQSNPEMVMVGPEGVAKLLRPGAVVIVFPGGTATVERWG